MVNTQQLQGLLVLQKDFCHPPGQIFAGKAWATENQFGPVLAMTTASTELGTSEDLGEDVTWSYLQ